MKLDFTKTQEHAEPHVGGSTLRVPDDVAPQEVERSLKRGASWAMGAQVAQQAIRMVSVLVLARLLTPDDYGAAALAVALAAYAVTVGDLGLGTALVQATSASQRTVSTAYWCALAAGVLGSSIAALSAYPAARAFNQPSVAPLVIAGGLTFFLYATGSTSSALLVRSMNFRLLQVVGLITSGVASLVAISVAFAGAGAWALVLQQVALFGLTSLCLIFVVGWRPSLQFSRPAFTSLARFALPFTGASVFFLLQGFVAALLIGRLLGLSELGIWTFSMSMVILPISLIVGPLATVLYAAFARMRDRPERMAEVWLSATVLLAAVALPMIFGLIAVVPDLIPFAFGSKWTPAVPVIQILCLFALARSVQAWNTSVIDAAGKPHISMFSMAAVLLLLPFGIWFGSSFGIEGVAVLYVLIVLLCAEIPSFVFTTRELSVRPGEVVSRMFGIVLSSLVMFGGVVLTRFMLDRGEVTIGVRLVLSISVGVVAYGCCLSLFAPVIFHQVRHLLARPFRASRAPSTPS